jgi:hypothetical protein
MAVSQNIARLRALLAQMTVSKVTVTDTLSGSTTKATVLSGSRHVCTDGDAASGGANMHASTAVADPTALSVANSLSLCTTTAGSGAFSLAQGTSVGQLKYVILKSKTSSNLTVSGAYDASISGANPVTASLSVAGDALGLVWDGGSWCLLTSGSSNRTP